MSFKNISIIVSAVTGDASKGLELVGKQVEMLGVRASSINKNFLALGTGLAIAAIASVKMASDFQRSLELIHTQAGASQAEVDGMRNSILALAPAVGQGPVKLADAMYHIESIGLRGAKALDVLHTAAMGATIGNADLEQTTNALASTIASNIGGFHGMKDAMAILNNTVGQGNMRMDDLAASMSTGVLPAAKTAGLGLIDVGAALATMTDTGVPAEEAATRLRMTFALMSAPTGAASKALKEIGLTNTALAVDMHKPNGLLIAVEDLRRHLGNLHSTAGQIAAEDTLVKAFGGGRSSGAIMTLIQEVDRLQTKYASYGTVASRQATFQDAWAKTTETFSFKMHQLGAELQVVGIRVGTVLIPVIENAVSGLQTLAHWLSESVRFLNDHRAAVAAVGAAWIAIRWGAIAQAATTAMMTIRMSILYTSIVAKDAMVAVGGLGGALSRLGYVAVAAAVVYLFVKQLEAIRNAGKGTAASIKQITDQLGQHPDTAGFAEARKQIEDLKAALKNPEQSRNFWANLDPRRVLNPNSIGAVKDYKKSLQELNDELALLDVPAHNLAANLTALAMRYQISTKDVQAFADAHKVDLTQSVAMAGDAFDKAILSATHMSNATGGVIKAYDDLAAAQTRFAPTVKDANDTLGKQFDLFDALPAKIKLSGAALLKNIADQTKAMLDEGANVQKLVREGLDPGMIKALVDKGPEYVAAAASLSVRNVQKFGTEYHKAVSQTLTTTQIIARAEAPKAYQAIIDAANAKKKAIADANKATIVDQLGPALATARSIAAAGSVTTMDGAGRKIVDSAPKMLKAYLASLPAPLAEAVKAAMGIGHQGGLDIVGQVAMAIVAATPHAAKTTAALTKAIQAEINSLQGKTVTVTVDDLIAAATMRVAGKAFGVQWQAREQLFPYFSTHAEGGPISGGRPGRDSVPVLAMPDEHMLTVDDVRAMGGHDRVFAFRRALHLAGGGPVITNSISHPPAGALSAPAYAEARRLATEMAHLAHAVIGHAQGTASDMFTMPAGGTGGGVNRWAGTVLAVLAALRQPAGLLAGVLRRIGFESGGDPTAVNRTDPNWFAGHPSVGLMQVIRGTFAAYAGQYRGIGPFAYGVSENPFANIYAGANYAISRYGSLSAVDPVNRPRGYDDGGWLMPGWTLAHNGTGRPEPVGGGGVTINAPVTITVSGADSPQLVAAMVDRKVSKAFDGLARMITAGAGRG